ncbi:hypothetical protein XENTR_v10016349 [Xenopus tropicalis]|uniref:M-phase-specific PLK1-interacting protein n=1 Tax=Xenopus tropicalis TaxID=8364 RepID=Q6P820_XENTR|eukprot:NP_989025.1 M-phase-specific PLK1-interacting protein [Xenopus tropicalis]
MHRQNFRSPSSSFTGGNAGSPGSFRSPISYQGGGLPGPMLPPPPIPNWGYGSPRTPPFGHWPPRGGQSPRSSPNSGMAPPFHGGRFGGHQSPSNNTPPRRPSPRYNSPPYNKSPGGSVAQFQHRGYSPRQSYQGSPRTSTPFGTAHGREKRVSNDVENYYRPSMLEDPWANLKPLSYSDINQNEINAQTTNTGKKGRYFS